LAAGALKGNRIRFLVPMETLTKPEIVTEIIESLQTKFEEERQVIVHCCFPASYNLGTLIRIWPSTFLIDESMDHQSALIHHENISLYPEWTMVPPLQDYWFTLVFKGLPKACKVFDLKEVIPESGGFHVQHIKRNATDIYRVVIV